MAACRAASVQQIWDTAGQERFRTITTSYFRGAQGILLVYDVTDRQSFENINKWVSQIADYGDKHVNKILIGNKCDMEKERVVSEEEGRRLAKTHDMPFYETSAKANMNVSPAFEEIARLVMKRLVAEPKTGGGGGGGGRVTVDNKSSGGKGGGGCGGCVIM